MAQLPLVYYPDVVLKKRCEDITEIDDDLVQFVRDMAETMYVENGIGLAAPQVARSIRLITVDVEPDSEGATLIHLINPVIVDSHGRTTYEEGCLSFPEITGKIKRPMSVAVRFRDIQGAVHEAEATGLVARAIQHEIDHLHGVLFIDRMSPVKKTALAGRLKRLRRLTESNDGY